MYECLCICVYMLALILKFLFIIMQVCMQCIYLSMLKPVHKNSMHYVL